MSLKTPKSTILDYLVSLAKCISVYRIDTLLSRQTKLINCLSYSDCTWTKKSQNLPIERNNIWNHLGELTY